VLLTILENSGRNLKTSTYGKCSLRQASLSVEGNKRGGAPIKLRTGLQLNSRMFSWQVRIAVSGYFTLVESEQYHDRTVPLLAPLYTLCSTKYGQPSPEFDWSAPPTCENITKGGARRCHSNSDIPLFGTPDRARPHALTC